MLARLGGDEFAIIQDACDDQRRLRRARRADREAHRASRSTVDGHRVEIGTSIGIAHRARATAATPEQLLKKADSRSTAPRSAGRQLLHASIDEAMTAEREPRSTLESDLREPSRRCQFEVHYQPFIDVATGAVAAFEALVRWQHPDARPDPAG